MLDNLDCLSYVDWPPRVMRFSLLAEKSCPENVENVDCFVRIEDVVTLFDYFIYAD